MKNLFKNIAVILLLTLIFIVILLIVIMILLIFIKLCMLLFSAFINVEYSGNVILKIIIAMLPIPAILPSLYLCQYLMEQMYVVYNFTPIVTPRQMTKWVNETASIFTFTHKNYIWCWRNDAILFKLTWVNS